MANNVNNMVLQVETEDLKLKQIIGDGTGQTIIETDLEVPHEKPDIEKVLTVDVKVKPNADIRVIDDKVIIDGSVDVDTLYVGETRAGDQPVHSMEHTINFGAFVDVPGAEKDADADVDVEVENVEFDVIESCKVRISIVLKITARVTEIAEVEVVTDMRLVPPGTIPATTTQPTTTTGVNGGMVTIPGTDITIPIEGGPIGNGGVNGGMNGGVVEEAGETPVAVGGVSQTIYTVVSGDTLGAIALRYGVTVQAIARANNIADVNKISIGQRLVIPGQ